MTRFHMEMSASHMGMTRSHIETYRRPMSASGSQFGPGRSAMGTTRTRSISPEATKRIFERLYQVSEHCQGSCMGLGLGLYICKELVTRQGGPIWVNSRPLTGTTFSFMLPVFSLNNWRAPLLKNYKWPAQSVALVMVEVCLLNACPSKEAQRSRSREARSLVERCLLPELDVLPAIIGKLAGQNHNLSKPHLSQPF